MVMSLMKRVTLSSLIEIAQGLISAAIELPLPFERYIVEQGQIKELLRLYLGFEDVKFL